MSPHLWVPGLSLLYANRDTYFTWSANFGGSIQHYSLLMFYSGSALALALSSPRESQSERGPSQARRTRHRNKFAAFFYSLRLSHDSGVMIFMTPYNWCYAWAYLMEAGSWQGQVRAAPRSSGAQSSTLDGHCTLLLHILLNTIYNPVHNFTGNNTEVLNPQL